MLKFITPCKRCKIIHRVMTILFFLLNNNNPVHRIIYLNNRLITSCNYVICPVQIVELIILTKRELYREIPETTFLIIITWRWLIHKPIAHVMQSFPTFIIIWCRNLIIFYHEPRATFMRLRQNAKMTRRALQKREWQIRGFRSYKLENSSRFFLIKSRDASSSGLFVTFRFRSSEGQIFLENFAEK